MSFQPDRRWAATGLFVLTLFALPLFLSTDFRVSVVIGGFFYAILASSWALLGGLAGQFSFAHMALMGFAAYVSALLGRDLAVAPWLGILVGTVASGLLGLIIGTLCLRLRAAYLALFTIAFSEILRIILLTEFRYTEGDNGVQMASLYPGIGVNAEYYVMLVLLLASMALMYGLVASRFGLFIRAMREDEEAAAAMGVNVVRYKVLVFTITSMVVGLAGGVYYHQVGIITPNTMNLLEMALVIAYAVIGGIESLLGAALGAFLSRISLQMLVQIDLFGWHFEPGAWRFAAFGLLLLFTLRFSQNGLLYPLLNRFFARHRKEETVAQRNRPPEVPS